MYRNLDKNPAYPLTMDEIDRHVVNEGPGRFVLGFRDARGAFRIQFMGRTEGDPNATLKMLVGKYKAFKFARDPLERNRERQRGAEVLIHLHSPLEKSHRSVLREPAF